MSDDDLRDVAIVDDASGTIGVRRLAIKDIDNDAGCDYAGRAQRRSCTTLTDAELSCFQSTCVARGAPNLPPFDGETLVPDNADNVDEHRQMALLSMSAPTPTFADPCDVVMETATDAETDDDVTSGLPFPGFVERTFYVFDQTTRPRNWCLRAITWPYPFIVKRCVILIIMILITVITTSTIDL